jgi:hypothetical protein
MTIGEVYIPAGDMLRDIMKHQADFQARTPDGVVSFKETNPERMAEMVRTQTLACIAELLEALEEIGWKPWATSRHMNVEAFRSELVDAFRFWLNLVHISGMSPEGLFQAFMESHAKTDKRVTNGYTGINKCPRCHRAYDDKAVRCTPTIQHNWMDEATIEFWKGISYCDGVGFINHLGEHMTPDAGGQWVLVDPA